jgi:CO/xanthine dehydrogenase Mo-binding subunit
LTVFTVAGDQGTGLQTVLCQTVATEMQVPYDQVRCRIGNTADVSYSVDVGFGGSRSTNINSAAAFQASAELRKKLNGPSGDSAQLRGRSSGLRVRQIFQQGKQTQVVDIE